MCVRGRVCRSPRGRPRHATPRRPALGDYARAACQGSIACAFGLTRRRWWLRAWRSRCASPVHAAHRVGNSLDLVCGPPRDGSEDCGCFTIIVHLGCDRAATHLSADVLAMGSVASVGIQLSASYRERPLYVCGRRGTLSPCTGCVCHACTYCVQHRWRGGMGACRNYAARPLVWRPKRCAD